VDRQLPTCDTFHPIWASIHVVGPPNGLEVHLRGQGPRAEADAAHGVHACESRDAGRAPPSVSDSNEAARPPDRSRAASGATSS
jgi:hypothetical protein